MVYFSIVSNLSCDEVSVNSVFLYATKIPDGLELEKSFIRVMIVLRFMENKDVFEKFCKMLAKRLIQGLSGIDDAETVMISSSK